MTNPNLPTCLKKGSLTLVGLDSNAFSIMGAVRKALKAAGNTPQDIQAVVAEMMGGDYDHLLATAMEVVEDEFEDEEEYEDEEEDDEDESADQEEYKRTVARIESED